MSKINELRAQRAKTWEQTKAFLDSHRNEKGILSAQDTETYERMEQEIVNLGHEIDRQERMDALEREMAAPVSAPITAKPDNTRRDEKTGRASDSYKNAFWAQVRAKDGVSYEIRNALSEGVDTEGGYLVPDEFEHTLVQALEEDSVIRANAHVFTTSNGVHKIPVVATKGVANWIDENGAYGESDDVFGQEQIDAHKVGTIIKVSEELLNDSAFNLEQYFTAEFARRIGAKEEEAFLIGDGSKKPTGLLNAVGGAEVGVTAASGTAITADELIDLFYSLKAPYRKNAVWDGFCQVLAPVFEGAFTLISNALSTAMDVIVGILDIFIGLFTGNWAQMWDGVKSVFTSIWNGIGTAFSTILNTLKGVADVFLGWFGTSWDALWTSVSTFFSNIWNGIVSFFTGIWETLKNVVTVGIQFIGAILQAAFDIITLPFRFIWENCKETITTVWDAISNTVSTVISTIADVISTVMTAIQTVISTIWTAISTKVSTVLNTVKTTVSTVFNAIKTVASTVWNGIKTAISTVVDGIKSKVSSAFEALKSTVSSVFEGIKSTATSVWNSIKTAITTPIESAKNTIKSALDSVSGFFAGLHLELPHIKLPHFSVSGTLSINPPSVPHLSISWYKDGGILTSPTIFGMNGSSLMAGGEAGAEAVLPLSSFYKQLESILTSRLNNDNVEKYLSIIAANSGKGIYLDDGTLVGRLLPAIDSGLGKTQKLNARLSL